VKPKGLECHERARARVIGDVVQEQAQLGPTQVRGHAEGAHVQIEGLAPDRSKALGQVVMHMVAGNGAVESAVVDPRVVGQRRTREAGGQAVAAAEVEDPTPTGPHEQLRQEARKEGGFERAPYRVVLRGRVGGSVLC